MRIRHYSRSLVRVLTPSMLILTAVPSSAVAAFGVWLALVLLSVVALSLGLSHDHSGCVYCFRRLPRDPERAIRRNAFALRLYHQLKRAVRHAEGLLTLPGALTLGFGTFLAAALLLPGTWGLVFAAASVAGGYHLITTHERLSPWCPDMTCTRRREEVSRATLPSGNWPV